MGHIFNAAEEAHKGRVLALVEQIENLMNSPVQQQGNPSNNPIELVEGRGASNMDMPILFSNNSNEFQAFMKELKRQRVIMTAFMEEMKHQSQSNPENLRERGQPRQEVFSKPEGQFSNELEGQYSNNLREAGEFHHLPMQVEVRYLLPHRRDGCTLVNVARERPNAARTIASQRIFAQINPITQPGVYEGDFSFNGGSRGGGGGGGGVGMRHHTTTCSSKWKLGTISTTSSLASSTGSSTSTTSSSTSSTSTTSSSTAVCATNCITRFRGNQRGNTRIIWARPQVN